MGKNDETSVSSRNKPYISIIVRTIGRPSLRLALLSLKSQTLKDFEVIIVEDGEAVSKDGIFEEFPDLNISYCATNKKIGRIKAGNIGLKKAKGEYLIFLDDDDEFFPDHLEILYNTVLENREYKAVYSIALEVPTRILSINPYIYEENTPYILYNQPFNRLKLLLNNYIPIQSLLFNRELYENYGGFDESLEYLEDWDLWVRYACHTDFLFIPKITSKYRVPAFKSDISLRTRSYTHAEMQLREKEKCYLVSQDAYKFVTEIEDILKNQKKDNRPIFIPDYFSFPRKMMEKWKKFWKLG